MAEQLNDLWKDWFDGQEKVFDFWKETMSKITNPDSYKKMGFAEWMGPDKIRENFQEWYKNISEGYTRLNEFFPSGMGKETYDRIIQGMNMYGKLFSFWVEMVESVPVAKMENLGGASREWMESYRKVLNNFFSMFLPEPARAVMENFAEITALYQETVLKFLQPWLDSSEETREGIFKSLKGDREGYLDLLRSWHRAYEESFGKIYKMPGFGLSRENFEKFMSSIDTYIEYQVAVGEFNASLYKIGFDVMDAIMQKMGDPEGSPASFKEFYQLWWRTNEDAYFELFKTESFAKMMGEMVDAGIRFKKRYDDLLSDIIAKTLPIPTNREMDSVYKTVYHLKKKSRSQAGMLDEINQKVEMLSRKIETLERTGKADGEGGQLPL